MPTISPAYDDSKTGMNRAFDAIFEGYIMQNTRPIDLHALRVFLTAAEDCNMSRAAERLGITQSAVSQSVRVLEESFGTPLLNRSGRPLTLTPAGLSLYSHGRVLLESALNLRGTVIEASNGIKPSLRIGLVDSIASTCGAPIVKFLLKNTAQLTVRTGLTPGLSEALMRRELDLAITTRRLESDGVVNQILASEQFIVITPKDYPLECRTFADLAALSKALPVVRFNQQSHLGEQVERALRRAGLNLQRKVEVETADTLTSMVAGGIGWAMTTPFCLLQGGRSAAAVRHHFIPPLNAQREIYIHARQGEYGVLAHEFFEQIAAIVKNQILQEFTQINPLLLDCVNIHEWHEENHAPDTAPGGDINSQD